MIYAPEVRQKGAEENERITLCMWLCQTISRSVNVLCSIKNQRCVSMVRMHIRSVSYPYAKYVHVCYFNDAHITSN